MQLDAREQHLVGHLEGVGEGGLLVGDAEQILVRNDDQRIDMAMQLVDAVIGEPRAAVAFEGEGLGHDADRQDALLASGSSDHRRRARTGAAAHARGDEHHVRAGEMIVDLVEAFLGRGTPDFRVRAGTESFGDRDAQLDDALRLAERQRLRVGIGADEVDAVEARNDHIVDRVAASASHTEYGDPGLQFLDVGNGKIDGHEGPHGTGVWPYC